MAITIDVAPEVELQIRLKLSPCVIHEKIDGKTTLRGVKII